jgi:hypothetical protein
LVLLRVGFVRMDFDSGVEASKGSQEDHAAFHHTHQAHTHTHAHRIKMKDRRQDKASAAHRHVRNRQRRTSILAPTTLFGKAPQALNTHPRREMRTSIAAAALLVTQTHLITHHIPFTGPASAPAASGSHPIRGLIKGTGFFSVVCGPPCLVSCHTPRGPSACQQSSHHQ